MSNLVELWQRDFDTVPPVGAVLAQSPKEFTPCPHDAQALAEAEGWATAYDRGRWFFSGKLVELFRRLREILRQRARSLGFSECLFPRMLTRRTVDNFGLLEIFPKSIVKYHGGLGDEGYLDPVQCAPFYDLLQTHRKGGGAMPLLVFESGGYTFRDEPRGRLDRFHTAQEFLRCEYTFAGSPNDVVETRRLVLESLTDVFDTISLDWRLVVGAGCSDAQPASEHTHSSAEGLRGETLPVIDIELPFTEGEGWVESVGGALHFTSKTGRICSSPNDCVWSGCVGVGLNRVAYAYLCRHGAGNSGHLTKP